MNQKEIIMKSILDSAIDNSISDKRFFDIIDEYSVSDEMLQEIFVEIENRNIVISNESEENSFSAADDLLSGFAGKENSKSKQSNSASITSKQGLSDSSKSLYISKMVENLPVLRAKSGLTQAELAELVGVSRQTILSAEKKQRELTWSMFLALLIVFGSYEKTAELIEIFEIRPEGFKQIVKSTTPSAMISNDKTRENDEIKEKYEIIISEKNTQIEDLNQKLSELGSKLAEVESSLSIESQKSEIENTNIEAKYDAVISEKDILIQNLNNQLIEMKNRLSFTESKLSNASFNSAANNNVIAQYEAVINERNLVIQNLNNQLFEANNRLSQAGVEISIREDKLKKALDSLSAKEDVIRKLNEELIQEKAKPWHKKLFGK